MPFAMQPPTLITHLPSLGGLKMVWHFIRLSGDHRTDIPNPMSTTGNPTPLSALGYVVRHGFVRQRDNSPHSAALLPSHWLDSARCTSNLSIAASSRERLWRRNLGTRPLNTLSLRAFRPPLTEIGMFWEAEVDIVGDGVPFRHDQEGNPGCDGTALWGTGSHPWEAS
jgi:hypothetical protein